MLQKCDTESMTLKGGWGVERGVGGIERGRRIHGQ